MIIYAIFRKIFLFFDLFFALNRQLPIISACLTAKNVYKRLQNKQKKPPYKAIIDDLGL